LAKSLNRRANVEKIGTITSKRSCLQDGILFIYKILLSNVVSKFVFLFCSGKSRNPVCQDGQYTGLYITEIEAIFGLPQHFTDVGDLSIASRQKLIGRAWSVQVISKLFLLFEDTFAKIK